MRAILIGFGVATLSLAGCTEPDSSCAPKEGGLVVQVTVHPDFANSRPTTANVPVYIDSDAPGTEGWVDEGLTNRSGCIAFDTGSQGVDIAPGEYTISTSHEEGKCDWFAEQNISYDGSKAFCLLSAVTTNNASRNPGEADEVRQGTMASPTPIPWVARAGCAAIVLAVMAALLFVVTLVGRRARARLTS